MKDMTQSDGHPSNLTPSRCRAARALLAWSQRELAEHAGLGSSTVADFERGHRAPADSSMWAIMAAFEKAGVAVTPTGAENRAELAETKGSRLVPGEPMRWVTATDLANWGGTRAGQDTMPELVMRLVRAGVGSQAKLLFPSDDSVQMPGFDGVCEVSSGTEHIPSGSSVWEIGTQRDKIRAKADSDYSKRTVSTPLTVRRASTFVFVTPQRWSGAAKWAATKGADRAWADVRAYDADVLVHWIEMYPLVGHWLASLIGRRPPGLRRLEEVWEDWSLATEPPITAELVLAGRDEESIRALRWLRGETGLLSYQADSRMEAIAFLHASISTLPRTHSETYLSRAIVAAPEQARALGTSMSGLIIVLEEPDPGLAATLAQRHLVYVPIGTDASSGQAATILPRPLSMDVEAALETMGLDPAKARRFARESGRSATVIRRIMPLVPGAPLPRWMARDVVGVALAALVAGAWNARCDGDKEVVARLAGEAYPDAEARLVSLASGPDSLLWRVSETWKIVSTRDAWFTLADQMPPKLFDTFSRTVIEVLQEPDPTLELAPSDRWLAGGMGIASKYSPLLKAGLAESLAFISTHGQRAGLTRQSVEKARYIVHSLLLDADGPRWSSLAPVLMTLAEAAPEEFLGALVENLDGENPTVMALFGQDEEAFSGARHSSLLWALECLAWSADYLPDVTRCLAALDRLDPGGRYANRPGNSLRTIFLPWSPQTTATLDKRMEIIRALRTQEEKVSWRLMLDLLPRGQDTTFRTPLRRWRDFADSAPSGVSPSEVFRSADILTGLLLEDVSRDADRWCDILDHLNKFTIVRITEAVGKLDETASSWKDEESRHKVREKLRTVIHHHRQFQKSDWAMPSHILGALEATLDSLTPSDLFERLAWLFENSWEIRSLHPSDGDWQEDARKAGAARVDAVKSIVDAHGSTALLAFSTRVAQPRLVGDAVAASDMTQTVKMDTLLAGLRANADAERDVSRALVAHLNHDLGATWTDALLERALQEAWSAEDALLVLLALPSAGRTWQAARLFGAEVEELYWRSTHPFVDRFEDGDLRTALDRLVEAGRPWIAVEVASQRLGEASSDALLKVLHSCASSADESDATARQYRLERILSHLDTVGGLDRAEAARLEWAFFPLLRHSRRGLVALHGAMSEDPTFFVQVLSTLYISDLESSEEATEERPLASSAERALATKAYQLLSSWRTVPGLQAHSLDGLAMEDWVKKVRSAAKEAGRLTVADNHIGQVLAHAPSGSDGFWPDDSVRRLVETLRSKQLESGIETGLFNKRGVTIRDPHDGGALERVEAERYGTASAAMRVRSPRMSAILARLARSYLSQANTEDEDVERRQWPSGLS